MRQVSRSPGRSTAAELAAAVRASKDHEHIRDQLLERAVAADPGSVAWDGELEAAFGALPRERQASIVDRVDSELEEIVRLASRQAIAALDPFGGEATVDGVLTLVAIELGRRELREQGVGVIASSPTLCGGSRATRILTAAPPTAAPTSTSAASSASKASE